MNDKRVPIAVAINETKIKMVAAIHQAADQSGLPPSILVGILDTIRAQFMENALTEMKVLYEDALKANEQKEVE